MAYLAEFTRWAKHFGIPPPAVVVRKRHGGSYRKSRRTISLPANAGRDALVHEFAHHLAAEIHGTRGHGPHFRIALVETATVAYGRATRYPWASEYRTIAAWARRHGLGLDAAAAVRA
jgi:hypothetical protein